MSMDFDNLYPLALALGLGLLVGLQRERAEHPVAGIRTFPLITMLGVLCMMFSDQAGIWLAVAGLLSVALLLVQANLTRARGGSPDPGLTTEVAALVMFLVGAALPLGYDAEAVVVSGVVAMLLQAKESLHQFSRALGDAEVRAGTRLVLVALVILPVLPNQDYGPYGVLNPFEVWFMVVLIVGVSLGAYIIHRMLGDRVGALLGGALGGFISSTATTVSYARRAKGQGAPAAAASAVVIVLASSTVFLRVMFMVGLMAPVYGWVLLPPLAALGAVMAVLALITYLFARRVIVAPVHQEPPTDMRGPIVFGLLYAIVLLAVAYGRDTFGESGLYVVAAISGLTDMDAITLSTARLTQAGQLAPEVGWRIIIVGVLASLVFKGALAGILGGFQLFLRVGAAFAVAMAAGGAILYFAG
jgi:uncharacterized membrane protein (DUF4010 family)